MNSTSPDIMAEEFTPVYEQLFNAECVCSKSLAAIKPRLTTAIHDLFGGETVPDDEHYLNTLDGCKWHTLYCLTSLKSYCQKFLIHEYFIL